MRADAPLDRAEGIRPPSGRGRFYPARRTAWGSLLAVDVLVLVVSMFSGAHASLSFLWVAAALAVLIVARRITGGRARGEHRSARPRRSRRHRDSDEAWP